MIKTKKIFLIVAILVAAGFLLWGTNWLFQYYQYRTGPEYKAQKYIEEMEKKYREDAYGGTTPEETLQLFIDALKAGDTDLASKYFVMDKQVEWRNYLQEAKDKNNLNKLIDEAQLLKLSKKDDKRAFFTIANKQNVVEVQVVIVLTLNKKWKIEDL